MLFDAVFKIMQQLFSFCFDLFGKIEIKSGVTLWNVFLVFIVGGAITRSLISSLGGTTLMSASLNTARTSDNMDKFKNKPKQKERVKPF